MNKNVMKIWGLWLMVIGVIPLWAIMQYGLKMPAYAMLAVYMVYFMLFVTMFNRAKHNAR